MRKSLSVAISTVFALTATLTLAVPPPPRPSASSLATSALTQPRPDSAASRASTSAVSQAVLAKYQATNKQIKVAGDNARRAYVSMGGRPLQPVGEKTAAADLTSNTKKSALKKKLPRYLAVDTVPDKRSKGAKSVMIWDTQSQSVVGKDVYDLALPPPPHKVLRLETYSAEYVGAGL